ncbi:MAG: hypothetical protein LLG97_14385 [Deltaproteobacteria bacterium]|nr:hypothetical protein [Deltaproteobacteria bacterium]
MQGQKISSARRDHDFKGSGYLLQGHRHDLPAFLLCQCILVRKPGCCQATAHGEFRGIGLSIQCPCGKKERRVPEESCGVNDGETGHDDGRKKNPHPGISIRGGGGRDPDTQSAIGCIKVEDELPFEA